MSAIYSGFVPPCGEVNAHPAIVGVGQRERQNRFFFAYNAKNDLLTMANIILSKESSNNELKSYFEAVLKLSQSDNEFPINLEEVWMLAYSAKEKAVRALTSSDLFVEGLDFKVLAQNGENPKGGRPKQNYMLSVPCLEYFIARKVRPVFEVYRQVFHKAVKEPVFTESEIKSYLLVANDALADAEKKIKYLEKELHKEKAKAMAAVNIKNQESDLKNSCFFYLVRKGLYEDWNNFRFEYEQERCLKQVTKEHKEKQKRLPF